MSEHEHHPSTGRFFRYSFIIPSDSFSCLLLFLYIPPVSRCGLWAGWSPAPARPQPSRWAGGHCRRSTPGCPAPWSAPGACPLPRSCPPAAPRRPRVCPRRCSCRPAPSRTRLVSPSAPWWSAGPLRSGPSAAGPSAGAPLRWCGGSPSPPRRTATGPPLVAESFSGCTPRRGSACRWVGWRKGRARWVQWPRPARRARCWRLALLNRAFQNHGELPGSWPGPRSPPPRGSAPPRPGTASGCRSPAAVAPRQPWRIRCGRPRWCR